MCDANATAASRGRLLSWIEIDETAVESNVRTFRRRLRSETSLQAVVKSNAYGHGLDVIARAAGRAGVDSFGVHSAGEAEALAAIDPSRPMLILGYIGIHEADRVVRAGAEATVYNAETLEALSAAASRSRRDVRCHIKVETGVNRQGIAAQDLDGFIDRLQSLPGLVLAGVSTHFANIEDTTDHTFARRQLELFRLAAARVRERSPLADRPGLLAAAGYFGHLINCFTDGGAPESAFVDTARRLLDRPLTADALTATELLWGRTMGLTGDDPVPCDGLIRDHIGSSGFRIREHLLTYLSHQEERHA